MNFWRGADLKTNLLAYCIPRWCTPQVCKQEDLVLKNNRAAFPIATVVVKVRLLAY